ncbi:DUF3265 domain-containing protein [Vibrio vulnificus]|nr:DUF3265 domain-containing protein [Vibrio vulnificus]EKZ9226898.1 DUF3265 domain-containing protein [Vibrio vulnificus]
MTKHLSAIHNAWHFWFASSFVFKAQCGSRCVLRCSRLNAALGAVINFLVQISNFSLAICSSFSAIWLYLLKFLNHLTRKTC